MPYKVLFSTDVISTLSNVVFEHLPAYDDESPTEPVNEKEADQSSTGGGPEEAGEEEGKEARKQWGQGEGPPIVELLQHKQLQTATYAVDDGNTGTLKFLERERERERFKH